MGFTQYWESLHNLVDEARHVHEELSKQGYDDPLCVVLPMAYKRIKHGFDEAPPYVAGAITEFMRSRFKNLDDCFLPASQKQDLDLLTESIRDSEES